MSEFRGETAGEVAFVEAEMAAREFASSIHNLEHGGSSSLKLRAFQPGENNGS